MLTERKREEAEKRRMKNVIMEKKIEVEKRKYFYAQF